MTVFGEEWNKFKKNINTRFDEKDERIAELEEEIKQLKAKKKCRVGIYNGAGRDEEFSDIPYTLATTYYNVANGIPSKYEAGRVAKGVTPMAGLSTKNYRNQGNNSFMPWAEIADGKHDAYLEATARGFNSLNHEVWLSLDIEPDVKWNQSLVPQSWKPEDFGRAFVRMREIIEPIAPQVSYTYWVGGHQKELITRMYPGDDVVDRIGYDPYVTEHNSPRESALQCWGEYAEWQRNQSWGQGKPLGLTETGYSQKHSDEDQERFWQGAPNAVKELELEWVVLFHRDSGDYSYTMTNRPKGHAAYVAAMQEIAGV